MLLVYCKIMERVDVIRERALNPDGGPALYAGEGVASDAPTNVLVRPPFTS